MVECPTCGADVPLAADTVANELVSCAECSTELEVTGVNPYILKEAPQEEEDWGQ